MLGRFFLILVLLAVSLYVVKYLRIKWDEQQNKNKEASDDSSDNQQQSKKLMLKCQHCGLHIPDKEAIKQGDNIFCSLEHAKKEL